MKKKFYAVLMLLVCALTLGACTANMTSYLDATTKVSNWKGSKVNVDLTYNLEVKDPQTEEEVKISFPVKVTGEQEGQDKAHVKMNMDLKEAKKLASTDEEKKEAQKVPDTLDMDMYMKDGEVIFAKDFFKLVNEDKVKDIKEDYIAISDTTNGVSPKTMKYLSSEEFKSDILKLYENSLKDVKPNVDYKVDGNTYTLEANIDQIVDDFINGSEQVMKNWDKVSTDILNIAEKMDLPLDEESKNEFKALNKEYKAEDLKEAAAGIKEMFKGSKIIEKSTFEDDKLTQEMDVTVNVAGFVKVNVKGNFETVKDETVKIDFPTSVKKITMEEYMDLFMPEGAGNFLTVRLNAEDITFDDFEALPKIINNRTMIAASSFYEKIGAKVEWNEEAKTVTITKGDDKVVLTIGSDKAMVNGKEVALDSPATIINNKTYIPARFVSEAFGFKVKYDYNEGMPVVDIYNVSDEELATKVAELEKAENYKIIAAMKAEMKDEEIEKTLKTVYEGKDLEKLLEAKKELDKNPELLKKYQDELESISDKALDAKEEVVEEKAEAKAEAKEEKAEEKAEAKAEEKDTKEKVEQKVGTEAAKTAKILSSILN